MENCKFCENIAINKFTVHNYKNKNDKFGKFYYCDYCKLEFQPKKIEHLYDDQNSSNYNLKKNIFFYLKQFLFLKYIYNIKNYIRNKNDILDYGCGSGEFAVALSHCLKDKNIYTADVFNLDKKFIPKIKEHFIFDYNFRDKKFDLIIMRHVLEHIYDINSFLKEIKSNLRNDNSYLLIEVPNYSSVWRKIMKSRWPGYFYPFHYYVFSNIFLKNLLKKNNFKIIDEKKLEPPIFGSYLLTFSINNYICKLLSLIFYPLQYFISKIFSSSESFLLIIKKDSD
jgi:2-polyprenyl-3-methyl-5-hydroxy-6-metoxy-1,4-benzoquinol methylase